MSCEISIKVDKLSKCYQIYDNPRDRLKQMLMRGRRTYYHDFWALKDLSFEVRKGETIGILGRNGSGKSTLLQIVCGTLTPSSGTVHANGRIAALLELGSGFNPEFTGRENVYMNGSILGLSIDEIDDRFGEIAAFADIGQFIEQPVKTYSSGMMVRLAFAVAINVDPQILVVDEALSVGDELFQRKCFARIEAIKMSGATILFVSHSGSTVVELCDRAILLDSGELLAAGLPKPIVGRYQKLLYAPEEKRVAVRQAILNGSVIASVAKESCSEGLTPLDKPSARNMDEEFYDPYLKPQSTISYESHGALIEDPHIENSAGERVNCLVRGRTYRYVYMARFARDAGMIRFGMLIKTLSGVEVGGACSALGSRDAIPYAISGSLLRVEFSFLCSLNPGTYFLNSGIQGVQNSEETYLHRVLDACMFRVQVRDGSLATGIVDFNCVPEIEMMANQDVN
jgi:lipopolysaccharide transport system ATP-binding protein